ncbi:BglG family transcription antiterminator [Paenibacillus sp. JCM 10914]
MLNRAEGMTAAEIAAETRVSVRTVHREMEEIERNLAGTGAFLHRKAGTGFRLEGESSEQTELLKQRLLKGKPADYSGEERKILLLCSLLEAGEPIKLFGLAHSLKVNTSTIRHDLDELEPILKRLSLILIRRRGYGVDIEGEEPVLRKAICRLAEEYLDYSDLVGDGYHDANEPVTSRLLSMIDKPVLLDVERSLWAMNWSWTEGLSEAAYTSLLIALSVTVNRIRRGHLITEAHLPETADPISSDWNEVTSFAHRLEEGLGLTFAKAEIQYIVTLLAAARDEADVGEQAHADVVMVELTSRLIAKVQQHTEIPYVEDRTLRIGLVEHIGAAMRRIREGTRIRNPLLSPIRKDYEELFAIVRQAVDELRLGVEIPDEEIGFLVMHFGASGERLNQLGHQLRAILVCSSGLSSSRLLAIRLNKEMPQIEVLGNVSWYEAARMPEDEYDLIISTIDLPLPKHRYVRLSPLLSAEDKAALLQHIQNHAGMRNAEGEPVNRRTTERKAVALEQLRLQAALMNEIVSLLDHFHVYPLDNERGDLDRTLDCALDRISQQEAMADQAKVKQRLLDRERMGTQLIPDTALALFHTRSQSILKPLIALYRLAEAVPLEDGAEAKVILLMLAPKQLPKESLEVLSEISAMLLSTQLIELMEQGEEREIRSYLAEGLQHYYNHRP